MRSQVSASGLLRLLGALFEQYIQVKEVGCRVHYYKRWGVHNPNEAPRVYCPMLLNYFLCSPASEPL